MKSENSVEIVIVPDNSSLSMSIKSIKKTLIAAVGIIDSNKTTFIVNSSIGNKMFTKNTVIRPRKKPKNRRKNADVNAIFNFDNFIFILKLNPIAKRIIGIVKAAKFSINPQKRDGICKAVIFNNIPAIAAMIGTMAFLNIIEKNFCFFSDVFFLTLKNSNKNPQNKKTGQKNIVKKTALVNACSP